MNNIYYIMGVGGLGNSLFQIATAIYYKEEYGGVIILQSDSEALKFGTSNLFRKHQSMIKNEKDISYLETILKNFDTEEKNNWFHHNNLRIKYGNKKIIPKGNLLINGYCQNIDLFKKYINKIPNYLHLKDKTIIDYLKNKYKNIENGLMICLRLGKDFGYIRPYYRKYYNDALKKMKEIGVNINNIFIISDIKNKWKGIIGRRNIGKYPPAIEIDECDIYQIYAGLMCKNYILCESTFHLWIAYLNSEKTNNVIVPNPSDLTRRNLCLDNWIKIDI